MGERFVRFRRICEEVGRDPGSVRLSAAVPVFCGSDLAEAQGRLQTMNPGPLLEQAVCGTPDVVVEHLTRIAESGADTVYFHLFDVEDLDHLRLLGREVLPRLGR